jgi:hypothetical protein
VKIKPNQYGGVKGCSVEHLLVAAWNEICENLEDSRAATLVTAIDYAKAFNRLSYQCCLDALGRAGASSNVIALIATFLTNRKMELRVDNSWSKPREVHGGVPQGSLLGVSLFNLTTDDLENGPMVRDGDPITRREESTDLPPGVPVKPPLEMSPDANPTAQSTPCINQAGVNGAPNLRVGTPVARNRRIEDIVNNEEGVTFVFNTRARNLPARRLPFTQGNLDTTIPYEAPTKATKWQWQDKLPALFKFVDDGSIFSKVNMYNAVVRSEEGRVVHEKQDIMTENVFNRSKTRAEAKGMKINVKKTAMLVISSAISFTPPVLY